MEKKRYKSKTIIGWITALIMLVSMCLKLDLDKVTTYEIVEKVVSAIWIILVFIWRFKAEWKVVL